MSDFAPFVATPPRNAGRMAGGVYEAVKERLVSGDFAPGSKLSVAQVRTDFQVSKQPVMEAMRLLSADGLVEIVPQVGCVVATYPLREVADFFRVFAGFESAIAAAAAERRTDTQLRRLAEVSALIGALRDEPDAALRARSYRRLNRTFHATIHTMSASRIMVDTSRRLWDLSDFLINTTGVPGPLSSATASRHDDHEQVRTALEAGDAASARAAMERHISTTMEVLHAEFASTGARVEG